MENKINDSTVGSTEMRKEQTVDLIVDQIKRKTFQIY
jgi:hypothetical protein